jgi:hypothetical protein
VVALINMAPCTTLYTYGSKRYSVAEKVHIRKPIFQGFILKYFLEKILNAKN